ncbi:MAG: Gldg family protein, partial [Candidatus Cloacimonadaceae bacterium]|nr:Gldg family protein [Candidatus Cloacimonadaceae bacterium]
QLSYNVVPTYENDQMVFKEVVYGLTFEYQNVREVLNLGSNMENRLEYEITTVIRTLAKVKLPEIVVFRDSTYAIFPAEAFEKNLQRNFNVTDTDLNFIPNTAKVMLFTGLVDSLSANQLYQLDQFMMHGGKLVVLQERVPTFYDPMIDVESNFFDLLEHYGVQIRRNIVLDLVCDVQRMGLYDRIPFPVFPVVRGTESIITKNMNNIVLYLTSVVAPSRDTLSISFEPLLRTSYNSNVITGPVYEMNSYIMNRPTPDMFPMPPQTVGAHFKGDISSYFVNSDIDLPAGFVSEAKGAEIIVFADRELVVDIDNPLFHTRWYIILNALDYFMGNPSMIDIRSRSIQSSVFNLRVYLENLDRLDFDIPEIERNIKMWIRIICIGLPSVLLLLMGLYVHLRHKNYRKRIAEIYEKA